MYDIYRSLWVVPEPILKVWKRCSAAELAFWLLGYFFQVFCLYTPRWRGGRVVHAQSEMAVLIWTLPCLPAFQSIEALRFCCSFSYETNAGLSRSRSGRVRKQTVLGQGSRTFWKAANRSELFGHAIKRLYQ